MALVWTNAQLITLINNQLVLLQVVK